jgi:RHS repeat-associated protein
MHQVCVTVEIPEGPYQVLTPVQECSEVPDTGTISVSVLGFTATASYTGPVPDATLAAELAAGLNAAGSPVTAASSGATITITAAAKGTASDYALTIANGDYTVTGPSADLTGGQNIVSAAGAFYSWQIGSYAPNGNILSLTDSVIGQWSYAYDTLNRLTGAVAGAGNVPYKGEAGCWQYDAFGNRTEEAYSTATTTPCASGANDNAQLMNTPQNSANNNRLSTAIVAYDLAGDATNDGRNNYDYDGEGRLCAVAYPNGNGGSLYEQYVYDASGIRVAKMNLSWAGTGPVNFSIACSSLISDSNWTRTLSSQYLLDLSGDQVTELNGTLTNGQYGWVHSNAFSGGRLTATYDTHGLHYAIADPLGTKRVQELISPTGTAALDESCYSLPFGNDIGNPRTTNCPGPGVDATEHHFTGKERDTESGNDYFDARYYSSAMGRFMSPDWSAKEEPIPYAKLGDPQSLNLYAYVYNNPITGVDPDGHAPFSFGGFQDCHARGDCGEEINNAASKANELNDYISSGTVGTRPGDVLAQQQTAQGLAAQIPGQVKTAIMNSVNASNAPSGADTTGGFHEEGGIAGTNTNGGLVISPATPGAYSSSGVVSTSLTPADPALAGSITNLTVSWHVHPDGRTASGDLAWNQAPSGQDQKVAAAEHQALPGLIHIVVGAGNKQVYFYNGSSTVLQMSLKKFMAGAQ